MAQSLDTLTEKEKETLRLIVRGHDAKSAASELDLSVHTINERLRIARRKLDVTSSREAARMLLESEEAHPQNSVPKHLGDASLNSSGQPRSINELGRHGALWIGGIAMTCLLAIALALSVTSPAASPDARSQSVVASDAAKESAARDWLAKVDAGDWDAAHAAGSSRFRETLNLVTFRSATGAVREPLGEVVSREAIGVSNINQDGNDYVIVRFRTEFENGVELVEQVALEQDGGALKVTGYFLV